jgi:hypothetical protein
MTSMAEAMMRSHPKKKEHRSDCGRNRPDNGRDTEQEQCDPKRQKPPPILANFTWNLDVESLNVPHYHGLAPLRGRSVAARQFLLGFVGSMMSIDGIKNGHPRARIVQTASQQNPTPGMAARSRTRRIS